MTRRLKNAVANLHRWYRREARDLPWRRSRDPYAIWVSEVMLQQTQVATVLPYCARWMRALPDVASLAGAGEDRVLRLWEGLGYYSRARNLHRAATEVIHRFDGAIPSSPEAFRSLPGVGAYTCAAVMSIAFHRDMAAVDGNVKRVLSRLEALEHDPSRPPGSRMVENLAEQLLPPGSAALHNQAMMELGAVICTPRSPACTDCPVRAPCRARRSGDPMRYPITAARPRVPHRRYAVGLVLDGDRVLIDRRPPGGLLGGLWEFPRVELREGGPADDEGDKRALVRGLREDLHLDGVEPLKALSPVRHAYSHFKVTLYPWVCAQDPRRSPPGRANRRAPGSGSDARSGSTAAIGGGRVAEGRPVRWVQPGSLDDYPMSPADRKVMRGLLEALQESDGGEDASNQRDGSDQFGASES